MSYLDDPVVEELAEALQRLSLPEGYWLLPGERKRRRAAPKPEEAPQTEALF